MEYKKYVSKMVETYIDKLRRKAIFIKHYDSVENNLNVVIEKSCCDKGFITCFYSFSLAEMRDAYEPFLLWIKDIYYEK